MSWQEFLAAFKSGKAPRPELLQGVVPIKVEEDTTTVRGMGALARGPPCGKFEELVVLCDMEDLLQQLDEVETESDLKLLTSQWSSMKVPLLDLVSKSKKAAQDLATAQKVNNKKRKQSEPVSSGALSDSELWTAWCGDAAEILDMPCVEGAEKLDPAVPTFINFSGDAREAKQVQARSFPIIIEHTSPDADLLCVVVTVMTLETLGDPGGRGYHPFVRFRLSVTCPVQALHKSISEFTVAFKTAVIERKDEVAAQKGGRTSAKTPADLVGPVATAFTEHMRSCKQPVSCNFAGAAWVYACGGFGQKRALACAMAI